MTSLKRDRNIDKSSTAEIIDFDDFLSETAEIIDINQTVIQNMSIKQSYDALNEKCDAVLAKIKTRKQSVKNGKKR